MTKSNTSQFIQGFVSRFKTLRIQWAYTAWQRGISAFFNENVPFSYGTSLDLASKIMEVSIDFNTSKPLNVYECRVGMGMLARHFLDLLQKKHPEQYANTRYHISDLSEQFTNQIHDLGVLKAHETQLFTHIQPNASKPTFEGYKDLDLVIMSYLLDSLPSYHIEVSQGEIYEILIATKIESEHMAPNMIEQAASNFLLASKLIPFIRETESKIPLSESDMDDLQKTVIREFIASLDTLPDIYRFTVPIGLEDMLMSLDQAMTPGGKVFICDFGPTSPQDKQSKWLSSYGVLTFQPVCFPYIKFLTRKTGFYTLSTTFPSEDSQCMLLVKDTLTEAQIEKFQTYFSRNTSRLLTEAVMRSQIQALWPDSLEIASKPILQNLYGYEKEDYSVQLAIAIRCYKEAQYTQAIQMLRTIYRSAYRPVALSAILLLGQCFSEISNYDRAKIYFNQALVIDPLNALAHQELSFLALRAKDYQNFFMHTEIFLQNAGPRPIENQLKLLKLVQAHLEFLEETSSTEQ